MMFPVLRAFLAFFLFAIEVPNIHAGLILVSQSRSVSVRGSLDKGDPDPSFESFSDSTAASGFELFDAFAFGPGTFEASQTSFISSRLVTVVGSVAAFGNLIGNPDGSVTNIAGEASSSFGLTFDIEKTETWQLTANVNRIGLAGSSVFLTRNGESILGNFEGVQLLELTPGRYDLFIGLFANGDPSDFGDANIDSNFHLVPEPGSAVLVIAAAVVFGFRRVTAGRT